MNYKLLLSSLLEIIYIIYFFNFFKTRFGIHHPFEALITGWNEYLKHPINSGLYENKICCLGNILSYIYSAYILIRYILYDLIDLKNNNKLLFENLKNINNVLLITAVFLSLLMNINAFIYLIPIILFEYLYIYKEMFCKAF